MIVFMVWVAAAFESNEPIYSRSDRRSRVVVWTVALAWCLILFRRVPAPLDWRLLQPPCLLIWIGVVLTVVGLGFAVWARVCLGRSWDAYIRLKPNHKLIRTGPYAIVRHPIY